MALTRRPRLPEAPSVLAFERARHAAAKRRMSDRTDWERPADVVGRRLGCLDTRARMSTRVRRTAAPPATPTRDHRDIDRVRFGDLGQRLARGT